MGRLSEYLIGVLTREGHRGSQENNQIQPDAPVVDVFDIRLNPSRHLLDRLCFPPISPYLGEPSNSRLDIMTSEIVVYLARILLVMLDGMGSGSNQGHFPAEDVDELGQFVQAGSPEY